MVGCNLVAGLTVKSVLEMFNEVSFSSFQNIGIMEASLLLGICLVVGIQYCSAAGKLGIGIGFGRSPTIMLFRQYERWASMPSKRGPSIQNGSTLFRLSIKEQVFLNSFLKRANLALAYVLFLSFPT